jgi:hypothetical protein
MLFWSFLVLPCHDEEKEKEKEEEDEEEAGMLSD